jgi:hypothetical protein
MTPTTEHLKYGGTVQRLTRVCEASCPHFRHYHATYYSPAECECTRDDEPETCGCASPRWIPAFDDD